MGSFLLKHYRKHGEEAGTKTLEEYKALSYNVIKKPDAVYVERVGNSTYYVFYRGSLKVARSDDNVAITTLHRREARKWIKDRTERLGASIVRIL